MQYGVVRIDQRQIVFSADWMETTPGKQQKVKAIEIH